VLGGPGKDHEDRQEDHESQRIDERIGECDPGEYLLEHLDDPQTDLMGKKIKEREDVVDDSVQMLQIRRFLRKEDVHILQASLADRFALLGWNKARI
jgi:aryl carrier-like protein